MADGAVEQVTDQDAGPAGGSRQPGGRLREELGDRGVQAQVAGAEPFAAVGREPRWAVNRVRRRGGPTGQVLDHRPKSSTKRPSRFGVSMTPLALAAASTASASSGGKYPAYR